MGKKKSYKINHQLRVDVEIEETSIDNFPIIKFVDTKREKDAERDREWKVEGKNIISSNPSIHYPSVTWIEEVEKLEKAIKYFKYLCGAFPEHVWKEKAEFSFTKEEEEKIQKRLKELGYID
jgi:hypothetical protein